MAISSFGRVELFCVGVHHLKEGGREGVREGGR